jgi:hypothetical protein
MNRTGVLVTFLCGVAVLFGCKQDRAASEVVKQSVQESPAVANAPANPSIAPATVSAGPEASGQSAIVFDNAEFDFGDADQGEEVQHVFSFRNTGNATLVVENVRSS